MVESAVVIGTGLIGTSIALALRQRGVDVALSDRDSAALELACELGAGTPLGRGPAGARGHRRGRGTA